MGNIGGGQRAAAQPQQQQVKAISKDATPQLRLELREDMAEELSAAMDERRQEKEDRLLSRLPPLPIDWQVTYEDVYEVLVRCRREDGFGSLLKINEVCHVLRRFNVAFESARLVHLRLKIAPLLYHGVYVTREFVVIGTGSNNRFTINEEIYRAKHLTRAEADWML